MMRILIMFTILVGLNSCEEEDYRLNVNRGTASVTSLTDGVLGINTYRPTLQALPNHNSYKIDFGIYNDVGHLREAFTIMYITSLTDTLIPFVTLPGIVGDTTPNVRFFRLAADGDVLCGRYHANTLYDNWVIIDSFNVARGYINGRFNLSYVRDPDSGCLPAPFDTLILQDGIFEIDGFTSL